uniref:Uncharacterized protein n=1 Tax=Eutreptiella gymnastica TaxID=73025 RepID=A0A7S4G7Q1_9EUGL
MWHHGKQQCVRRQRSCKGHIHLNKNERAGHTGRRPTPVAQCTFEVRESDGSTRSWCLDKAVLARDMWHDKEGTHEPLFPSTISSQTRHERQKCGKENDGSTGSRCSDRALLAQVG